MTISDQVLKELGRELRALEGVRDRAIARIQALEIVMGRREPEVVPSLRPARTHRGESLRAEVVKALQVKSSSSALALSRHLEAEGFRVGGATTLRERVAHELSRLRRKGVVRRNRAGEYELCKGLNGIAAPPAPAFAGGSGEASTNQRGVGVVAVHGEELVTS